MLLRGSNGINFVPILGANVRKSRHVTGKNVSDSDSDTEMTSRGAKGLPAGVGTPNVPKKKLSVLFPPVRKEIPGLLPIEKRMCPMQGCDSSGHLGKFLQINLMLMFYLLFSSNFISLKNDQFYKVNCF